jgi:hypothetical protein
MKTIVIGLAWSLALQIHAASADEWTTVTPREEIGPQFQREGTGGKSGHGALAIRADEREGLHGWWQKTFFEKAVKKAACFRGKVQFDCLNQF